MGIHRIGLIAPLWVIFIRPRIHGSWTSGHGLRYGKENICDALLILWGWDCEDCSLSVLQRELIHGMLAPLWDQLEIGYSCLKIRPFDQRTCESINFFSHSIVSGHRPLNAGPGLVFWWGVVCREGHGDRRCGRNAFGGLNSVGVIFPQSFNSLTTRLEWNILGS